MTASAQESVVLEPSTVAVDPDLDLLFDVLENPTARCILAALGGTPATASEIAERSAVPTSTLYRQLQVLVRAGLVEKSVRVDPSGHHASAFVRTVSDISISLDDAGFYVDLD